MRRSLSWSTLFLLVIWGCNSSTAPTAALQVTVTPAAATLDVGEQLRLVAAVKEGDSSVTDQGVAWSSSDLAIATVDNAGLVTGADTGSTRIIAKVGNAADTATVVVVVKRFAHVVAQLPVAFGPWDPAISSQGQAYVTQPLTDSIAVVNVAGEAVPSHFAVGHRPDEVTFNGAGTKAFVTNLDDRTVGVIDAATNTQTTTFSVPGEPLRIRLGPNETKLYVTLSDGSLEVLDATSGAIDTTLAIGGTPNGLALNSTGTRLYVSSTLGTVTEINTATDAVLQTASVGGAPQDLVVAPGDTTLYVASESGVVQIWALPSFAAHPSISVPNAFGLALTPDGSRLLVSQPGSASVTVVDARSRAALFSVAMPGSPRHIAVTPDGKTALVADESGSVVILK